MLSNVSTFKSIIDDYVLDIPVLGSSLKWPLLASVAAIYLARKHFNGGKCVCETRLDGKVIIITGANTGIGKETAKILSDKGAEVVLTSRSCANKTAVLGNVTVNYMHLDLSSFSSIKKFSEEIHEKYKKIDILINNAGAFYLPLGKTEDGFESTMQINYLGQFLLIHLLLDLMVAGSPSRIINVSSHGFKMVKEVSGEDFYIPQQQYSQFKSYGCSKLALNLGSLHLAKILRDRNISVNLLTPGDVDTDIFRDFPLSQGILGILTWPIRKIFYKTSWFGAQTTVHLALSDGVGSGKYFRDCQEEELPPFSKDEAKAQRIFDETMSALGLKKFLS